MHACQHLTASTLLQGNCTESPSETFTEALSGASLLPLVPGQCVILCSGPLLDVRHGNLLLDNIYMRRQGSAEGSAGALVHEQESRMFFWQQSVKLWMTNVTMQARISFFSFFFLFFFLFFSFFLDSPLVSRSVLLKRAASRLTARL
jgi:hypothetical protein